MFGEYPENDLKKYIYVILHLYKYRSCTIAHKWIRLAYKRRWKSSIQLYCCVCVRMPRMFMSQWQWIMLLSLRKMYYISSFFLFLNFNWKGLVQNYKLSIELSFSNTFINFVILLLTLVYINLFVVHYGYSCAFKNVWKRLFLQHTAMQMQIRVYRLIVKRNCP